MVDEINKHNSPPEELEIYFASRMDDRFRAMGQKYLSGPRNK